MAVTVNTPTPNGLLAAIKKGIDEGHIATWEYDKDGVEPIEKREPVAIVRGEPLVESFSSYSSPEILEECLLRRLVPRDNWSRLQDRKCLSFFDRYQTKSGFAWACVRRPEFSQS